MRITLLGSTILYNTFRRKFACNCRAVKKIKIAALFLSFSIFTECIELKFAKVWPGACHSVLQYFIYYDISFLQCFLCPDSVIPAACHCSMSAIGE